VQPERYLASQKALAALDGIRAELNLEADKAGVIIDLYLSYRAISAWDRMLSLHEEMAQVLKRSELVPSL
jgi:hypothetical protein